MSGLDSFKGIWEVRRTVFDRLTRSRVSFSGRAEIGADGFREEGDTRYGAMVLQSSRSYLLRIEDDRVVVDFPDRREFIRIGEDASQALFHQCGADAYSGRLIFRNSDEWGEIWQVRGPRKNYRSVAVYRRV
ncbi:hypothetical protein DTW90_03160 [Neorhizobium sp. P12A]|uniref:DUF6314 family protein n=1 Tax=Neorhizobium sp. P12A TaxID=2268027 RepID=UPI0011EEEEAE|nr:DUF6314 family protein [Neorhizobium sp. P12A]KAA0700654.1 hypothetical protein DTW90_03160 [Neorhizobium sp. P12A]